MDLLVVAAVDRVGVGFHRVGIARSRPVGHESADVDPAAELVLRNIGHLDGDPPTSVGRGDRFPVCDDRTVRGGRLNRIAAVCADFGGRNVAVTLKREYEARLGVIERSDRKDEPHRGRRMCDREVRGRLATEILDLPVVRRRRVRRDGDRQESREEKTQHREGQEKRENLVLTETCVHNGFLLVCVRKNVGFFRERTLLPVAAFCHKQTFRRCHYLTPFL